MEHQKMQIKEKPKVFRFFIIYQYILALIVDKHKTKSVIPLISVMIIG